jgi:hypothetical protein
MAERMPEQLRRRILMFYFAAGINIVMAMWVMSAGSSSTSVSGGMLAGICLVFLAFAWINFRFAKMLKKRWEANMRARAAGEGGQASPP